jgi:hypothetical protein
LLKDTSSLFWKSKISETGLERDFTGEIVIPARESMLARPVLKALLCQGGGDLSTGRIVDVPRFARKERFSPISLAEEHAEAAWESRLNRTIGRIVTPLGFRIQCTSQSCLLGSLQLLN